MEFIKLALASLTANKLRSILTMLGIVVGIFSIVATSTVIVIMQDSIEEGTSMLGKNTFQIQKYPAMMNHSERSKYRNRRDISLEEALKLQELLTEAQYVGAEQWQFGKIIKYDNKETNPNVSVCGCTVEAFPNNKWIVEKGRLFTNEENSRGTRHVILGADIAKTLFDYVDPVGSYVKVDGQKMKVIGVLEPQGDSFGRSPDNFVAMPITTFQGFYGKRSRSINITVMAPTDDSYDRVIESAIAKMRIIRKVQALEEDDFSIFSNKSILAQINDITLGVRVGAFVIAAIALLAAGVGIMNIMLVSVTERTREIGIRKAVGAKKRSVLIQFLIEAVVLCIAGGIVGILLGVGVGNILGNLMGMSAVIPIGWVTIGLLICVSIGMVFGTYPAVKAARLDPIEALRYE